MHLKIIDYEKPVGSHFSYLASAVELWIYSSLDFFFFFFFLHAKFLCFPNTLAYLLQPTLICHLCLSSMLLTEHKRKCPVLFESCNEKETLTTNHFPSGFSGRIHWARRVSQGSEELSLNTWITVLKVNPYRVKYKSLSLHAVNKPYQSFSNRLPAPCPPNDSVAVCHSMQVGNFKINNR